MKELIPGVFFWSAYRDLIGEVVYSHYVVGARAVIDPMLPEEGLDWFEGERQPERVVLSQRHHWRDSEAFGVEVLCQEDGVALLEEGREATPFAYGEEPAPGIVAHPVWPSGWPGETALHLPDANALLIADAVIRNPEDGSLKFVSDELLGDDPEEARRELSAGLAKLAELEFDTLLLAHGAPRVVGGRDELRDFLA